MKINLAIVEDDDKEYTALIAAVERFGSENGGCVFVRPIQDRRRYAKRV